VLSRIARFLLVATALAPVSLVYGLSFLPGDRQSAVQWVAIALLLLAACLAVMRVATTRGERHSVRVSKAKNVDKEVLAFLVSYALPLISPVQAANNVIAFWGFMAIVGIVLYQAELVHVNPLLGILGYRFFEVDQEDGSTTLLITRAKTRTGEMRNVIELSRGLWLESPHA